MRLQDVSLQDVPVPIIRLLPTYIYLFTEAQNEEPFDSNVQRWHLVKSSQESTK